jgi:hypothetical protein
MVRIVLLVATAWSLLTVVGLLVLAAVRPELRNKLMPAAPLVGAAFLVVGLHGTGLFLPVRFGLPVVALAALAVAGVGLRRRTLRPFVDRSGIVWTLVSLAVAVPFTLVALAPSLMLHDSRIVSATVNHDAFWYVSVDSWFQDHTLLETPHIAMAPDVPGHAVEDVPGVLADGPAVVAQTTPMRVGHDLVQAALNVATGTSPVVTFSPWLAAWVLLVPGGCVAAVSLLRLHRGFGLAAGVLIASSHVLVVQVYNQNAASVLGVALAPLALAGVVAALDRRAPVLLAGVLLSGLIGIYTEYTPFVAPALVGATLLRRRDLRGAVVRAAGVVAAAVLVAPYVWVRAIQSLFGSSRAVEAVSDSPFRDAPAEVILNRLVGVGPVDAGVTPSNVALVLGSLVVLGCVLAIGLSRFRGLWIGMLAVGLPFIVWLSVGQLGYTQRRSIDIVHPLVLVMAVIGWGELLRRITARRDPGPPRAGAPAGDENDGETEPGTRLIDPVPAGGSRTAGATLLASPVIAGVLSEPVTTRVVRRTRPQLPVVVISLGLLATTLVWAGMNARSNLHSFVESDLARRHVDDTFSDAAQWVRDVGGREGQDVSVLVPSFFEQQWIAYELADEARVEYPGVRPSYLRTESYWRGGTDRFLLIGKGVQFDADPGVVVFANARFQMLDLSRGAAVVLAPHALTSWNTEVRGDGGFTTLGSAKALVLRSPSAEEDVAITLRAEFPVPFDATVSAPGQAPVVVDEMTQQPVDVDLRLPAGNGPVVVDLQAERSSDPAVLHWIEMTGVHREP